METAIIPQDQDFYTCKCNNPIDLTDGDNFDQEALEHDVPLLVVICPSCKQKTELTR